MKTWQRGVGWRKLRIAVGVQRWPTIRGENPPQGIPYRVLEASYGGRCLQLRLWNYRKAIAQRREREAA
jgi:hypothetical protein